MRSAREEQHRKAPRASGCRQYARKALAAAMPAILHRFIEEATKGSIPHAKALMTMADMNREEPPAVKVPARRRVGGGAAGGEATTLSELLLMELRRGSEKVSEATK